MSTSANRIVGIGGLPRSGKDSLAEFFMKAGFYGVSFGDIVRDFAFERHHDKIDPISVANMTETSNWLRSERGADAVLNIALDRYEEASKEKIYKGIVLFSVRAPVEVEFIIGREGEVIWVDAKDETRYERAMSNLRVGEAHLSFDEFKAQEALQWQPQQDLPNEVQMDMKYVKEHATITFSNNLSLEEFIKSAEDLVSNLTKHNL